MERKGQPFYRIVRAKPVLFTLRDFMQLWKTIPKPDPDYWDTLEEINRTQPLLLKSRSVD